jgi:putative radical SAM enzyme (TIGR03279 family)
MPTGVISAVATGSLAERIGLQPGDEVFSINKHPLRDIIDVRFYAAEERLVLQARRDGQRVTIEAERRYDEPLGLEFVHPTFDGIHRCNNRCEFCFISQMPPAALSNSAGLRRSLYIKDDDYRYSFLFGSYITLTNLSEADWQRIGEQHLSPLYVSVHATDLDLRRRILGAPIPSDVIAQLDRLVGSGIEVHTQIVVIPGLNDGPYLDRSIGDLVGLYPGIRSVSIVPVGLTRFHTGGCRVHTDAEMLIVFSQVVDWQNRLQEQLGVSFVYLSDEWYLGLGKEIPPLDAYDGLNLRENGVGLTRKCLNKGAEISNIQSSISSLTLVTGTLFAPVLQQMTSELANVKVVPVVNHFFGETVTVAGLLIGHDVLAQLRDRDLGDVVALPPAMFGGPEGQSLDEMWPEEIGKVLARQVVVGCDLLQVVLFSNVQS